MHSQLFLGQFYPAKGIPSTALGDLPLIGQRPVDSITPRRWKAAVH